MTTEPTMPADDVVPVPRERALQIVTDSIVSATGLTSEEAEQAASDVLDDLASSAVRLIVGWLPGEHEDRGVDRGDPARYWSMKGSAQ